MLIQIDEREDKSRIKSCVKYFTGKDYRSDVKTYSNNKNQISIEMLPIGDYVFNKKVAFEYKAPADMINSIMDNRVFRQAKQLQQYPFSYVVIVGDVPEEINRRNIPTYFNKYNQMKRFTLKNFLGAMARLYTYTNVVSLQNNQQCWILFESLVTKLLDENEVEPLDKPSFKTTDFISSVLGLVYINDSQRISSKQAVLIREHLHLESLEDLLNITYDDLIGIKGIGKKTAKAVVNSLHS